MDLAASTPTPFRADSPTLVHEIKDYIARHQEAVGELLNAGGEDAGVLASDRWARVFDGLLCALFAAVRTQLGDD
ncbi:MAG TPA: hypothetical protein VLC09_21415, partial [Polyangiaceae bacterium]|nr:hypothetical protein [Polyangiaceae bacterium]